jgi:acetyl-CoA carboxylase carboxyltransferase component
MELVQRQAAEKSGKPFDENQAAMMKMMMKAEIEKQSNAFYATGQGWDDGVIDPRDTRNVLSICLATIFQNEVKGTQEWGIYRM